jgi:hypothetical protein
LHHPDQLDGEDKSESEYAESDSGIESDIDVGTSEANGSRRVRYTQPVRRSDREAPPFDEEKQAAEEQLLDELQSKSDSVKDLTSLMNRYLALFSLSSSSPKQSHQSRSIGARSDYNDDADFLPQPRRSKRDAVAGGGGGGDPPGDGDGDEIMSDEEDDIRRFSRTPEPAPGPAPPQHPLPNPEDDHPPEPDLPPDYNPYDDHFEEDKLRTINWYINVFLAGKLKKADWKRMQDQFARDKERDGHGHLLYSLHLAETWAREKADHGASMLDMCIDECVNFACPLYNHLDHCPNPTCGKPRWKQPAEQQQAAAGDHLPNPPHRTPTRTWAYTSLVPSAQAIFAHASESANAQHRVQAYADVLAKGDDAPLDGLYSGTAYSGFINQAGDALGDRDQVYAFTWDSFQLWKDSEHSSWVAFGVNWSVAPWLRYTKSQFLALYRDRSLFRCDLVQNILSNSSHCRQALGTLSPSCIHSIEIVADSRGESGPSTQLSIL